VKYMMLGTYRTPTFVRLTLLWSTLFLLLFWGTNAALFLRNLGWQPRTIVEHYLGSEENFTQPRTVGGMLEVTHAHLAVMSIVLLLVTHLALFFPWPLRWRVALVCGAFGGALCGEAAGWLVRFVHPLFAWLKLAGFLSLQGCLAILLLGLVQALRHGAAPGMPRPAAGSAAERPPQV